MTNKPTGATEPMQFSAIDQLTEYGKIGGFEQELNRETPLQKAERFTAAADHMLADARFTVTTTLPPGGGRVDTTHFYAPWFRQAPEPTTARAARNWQRYVRALPAYDLIRTMHPDGSMHYSVGQPASKVDRPHGHPRKAERIVKLSWTAGGTYEVGEIGRAFDFVKLAYQLDTGQPWNPAEQIIMHRPGGDRLTKRTMLTSLGGMVARARHRRSERY